MRAGARELVASLLVVAASSLARADIIIPTSYSMPNGETGQFTYHDDTYTGSGSKTIDLSSLSGGLGDLTDGQIAGVNWFNNPGPYVAWNSINPIIAFAFAGPMSFTKVSIHFDDANGNGGVLPPSNVVINGQTFSVTGTGGPPFWMDFDVSTLATAKNTDALNIQLNRQSGAWVFVDEVKFEGAGIVSATPEPGSLLLLGSGFLAVGGLARRRKASRTS
jgi:hypothetical protein